MTSYNKDFNALLKKFPTLYMTRSKKHLRVIDSITGDFVIAAQTPSCKRSWANLQSDCRKLVHGYGYIKRRMEKAEQA